MGEEVTVQLEAEQDWQRYINQISENLRKSLSLWNGCSRTSIRRCFAGIRSMVTLPWFGVALGRHGFARSLLAENGLVIKFDRQEPGAVER